MTQHTLILVQYTHATHSRTFYDYQTVARATEGVVQLFERHLKEANPNVVNITYDVKDLLRFLDQLADLSALVYDPKLKAYVPFAKSWVKEQVGGLLKKQLRR